MKFNIFAIFAHKAQRGIESLITTKDKIEEIRRKYNKNAANYIKSAEDMLVNAKELKKKFDELDVQTATARRDWEHLVDNNKTDEAKIKFITWKGLKNARQRFSLRCKVAFGIGTWLLNDTGWFKAMNQVIKLTEVNGIPVCKVSDDDGKFMGKDEEYHQNLKGSIKWRVEHDN